MLSFWFSVALLAANPTHSSTVTLDLNQAPAGALVELPGIGPKKALAIVARRTQRPFRSLEELRQIRGIGKKTLERLRPRLRIGPATPAGPRSSPPPRRPSD
ncbi:MAG: helix-hairpin-helix domain-containing protein [Deltaproteobacteria bacterium]|jgi:competence ComEA-like helix-hairpin-helix protein|nr:helix-hairpin-helix domain-containing protein [Deltaproteobacteria bacterium]